MWSLSLVYVAVHVSTQYDCCISPKASPFIYLLRSAARMCQGTNQGLYALLGTGFKGRSRLDWVVDTVAGPE